MIASAQSAAQTTQRLKVILFVLEAFILTRDLNISP